MGTKQKGSIAELAVATDLAKRGYLVAFPFGNYGDFDLLVDRGEGFEKVQVKYSAGQETFQVRKRCHSVTAGRVNHTKVYSSLDIDWLAVYNPDTDTCYYFKPEELNELTQLRTTPPKNNQKKFVRWANNYIEI